MPEIERRAWAQLELRQADDSDRPVLVGYAAVFNRKSEDLGGFREIVAPGAFRRSLENGADVRALIDHDPSLVLGRTKAGTLRLQEDDHGLRAEIVLPDTQYAADLLASIRRGDVDQMSFGFRTVSDEWRTEDGEPVRTLKEVELFDVSVVTYPAYPDTTVATRSLDAWRSHHREAVAAELERRRAELELIEIAQRG